jgi:serine/threonine protein kinase
MKPGDPKGPRQKCVDDFTLGDVLGQSGFGAVRRVRDNNDGKEYAMKIMSTKRV